MQTIDLGIKIVNNNQWVLTTRNGSVLNINVPKSKPVPASIVPSIRDKRNYQDGDVVEVKLQSKPNIFVIVRKRTDKEANTIPTAMSVLNFINNPFTLDDLVFTNSQRSNVKEVIKQLTLDQIFLCLCSSENTLLFDSNELGLLSNIHKVANNKYIEFETRVFKNGSKGIQKLQFDSVYSYLAKTYPQSSINTADCINKNYRSEYPLVNGKILFNEGKHIYKNKLNETDPEEIKKLIVSMAQIFQESTPINPDDVLYSINTIKMTKYSSFNGLNYKFGLSEEKPTTVVTGPLDTYLNRSNLVRIKQRTSFYVPNEYTPNKYNWRIDLTVVKSGYGLENTYLSPENYELEIEFIGKNQMLSIQTFTSELSKLLSFILSISNPC